MQGLRSAILIVVAASQCIVACPQLSGAQLQKDNKKEQPSLRSVFLLPAKVRFRRESVKPEPNKSILSDESMPGVEEEAARILSSIVREVLEEAEVRVVVSDETPVESGEAQARLSAAIKSMQSRFDTVPANLLGIERDSWLIASATGCEAVVLLRGSGVSRSEGAKKALRAGSVLSLGQGGWASAEELTAHLTIVDSSGRTLFQTSFEVPPKLLNDADGLHRLIAKHLRGYPPFKKKLKKAAAR